MRPLLAPFTIAIAIATTIAPTVHADGAKARAEALFQRGRTHMAAGETADACPLFEQSLALENKLGTLLNLALCHEQAGKTASAWAEFTEARNRAVKLGEDSRVKFATAHRDKLSEQLSQVLLRMETVPPGAELTVDGAPMSRAMIGVGWPADPGSHEVRITAPGRVAHVTTIDVPPGPSLTEFEIPALAPKPVSPHPDPAPPSPAPPTATVTHPEPERPITRLGEQPSNALVIAGVTVGAVGLATLGVGLGLGGVALGHKSTVADECDLSARRCSQTGLDAVDGGATTAAASTGLVIAGGLLAATGIVLLSVSLADDSPEDATEPTSRETAELRLAPTVGGLFLLGRFE